MPQPLSRREVDIVDLLATGLTYDQIARRKRMTYTNVAVSVYRVVRKLELPNKSVLAIFWHRPKFRATLYSSNLLPK